MKKIFSFSILFGSLFAQQSNNIDSLIELLADKRINIPRGIFKWNNIDLAERDKVIAKAKQVLEETSGQLEKAKLDLEILADMSSVALDRAQLGSDENIVMLADVLAQREEERGKAQKQYEGYQKDLKVYEDQVKVLKTASDGAVPPPPPPPPPPPVMKVPAGGVALDFGALQQVAQQRAERLGSTDIDQMVQSQKESDQLIAELKKGVKLKERVVKEKEKRELEDIEKDLQNLESRHQQKKISDASYAILKGKLEDEKRILEGQPKNFIEELQMRFKKAQSAE